jgi:hypothetical protein
MTREEEFITQLQMKLAVALQERDAAIRDRDMYAHRCLELVKQHDFQRDEIEHLRRKRRERA